MKSVLACIDSDEFSAPVVQTAVALALKFGAKIHLIHVNAMGVLNRNGVHHDGAKADVVAWGKGWREIRTLQRRLLAEGVDVVAILPDELSVEGIATAIERLNVDLVLMPEPQACVAMEVVEQV